MKAHSLWQRFGRWLRATRAQNSSTQAAPISASVQQHAKRARPAEDAAKRYKHLRHNHREQLQVLIRETLLRHGILSTAYSFRALTLDREGQHFIVLLELDGHDTDTRHSQLLQMEADLQRLTQERQPQLHVKHVYWRVTNACDTPEDPHLELPPEFAPTQPLEPNAVRPVTGQHTRSAA